MANSDKKEKEAERNMVAQSFAMVMQFSLYMIVPILACTLFGYWLGEKTGVDWLSIPFFFLGALSGASACYRQAKAIYGKKRKTTGSDVSSAYISELYRENSKKNPLK